MADDEQRVTPLELFFDLVGLRDHAGHGPHVRGPDVARARPRVARTGRRLVELGGIRLADNTLEPEEPAVRVAMLGAMAAMLLVGLAVPEAFGADAVLFGLAYLAVRLLHLVLYALAGRSDPDLLGAVLRFAPSATLGPALLVAAGFVDGSAQAALWIGALAIDYLGALIGRGQGWRVSPAHFAERHGLIVIVALGESIVAIGIGAAGLPLDVGLVAAAVLGIAVVAALWLSQPSPCAVAWRCTSSRTSGSACVSSARSAAGGR